MTLKPFGNTSQAKTIKISSPNPTLAKRLGWGMRFGFIQGFHWLSFGWGTGGGEDPSSSFSSSGSLGWIGATAFLRQ